MRKFLILSLIFFTTDSFASGIASNTNSAPCTNNTLETYSGNSNLSADWQPNEIQLHWYNGNTQITPTNTTANTCIYDSTLTIPTNAPSRTGYTFAGWEVRPEYDFTTIQTSEDGTNVWAIGILNNDNYCWYNTNASIGWNMNCDSDSTYKELQPYEWKVKFSWGTIYGNAHCSAKSGNIDSRNLNWANDSSNWLATRAELDAVSGEKQHCWCQANGYKPNGNNILYSPATSYVSSAYLYVGTYSGSNAAEAANSCMRICAYSCAHYIRGYATFREVAFGTR